VNLRCFRAVLWNVGSGCTLVTCVRLYDLPSGQFIHSLYVHCMYSLYVYLYCFYYCFFILFYFYFFVYFSVHCTLCIFYFIITAALCVLINGWMDGLPPTLKLITATIPWLPSPLPRYYRTIFWIFSRSRGYYRGNRGITVVAITVSFWGSRSSRRLVTLRLFTTLTAARRHFFMRRRQV